MSDEAIKKAVEQHVVDLTDRINKLILERTIYMDSNMELFSPEGIKPGDKIYDMASGAYLGEVTRLYRYHRGDPKYDITMSVYMDYKTPQGYIDNTSRQYVSPTKKKPRIIWE